MRGAMAAPVAFRHPIVADKVPADAPRDPYPRLRALLRAPARAPTRACARSYARLRATISASVRFGRSGSAIVQGTCESQ